MARETTGFMELHILIRAPNPFERDQAVAHCRECPSGSYRVGSFRIKAGPKDVAFGQREEAGPTCVTDGRSTDSIRLKPEQPELALHHNAWVVRANFLNVTKAR